MANASDWQETLDDLDRRRRHTLGMGGHERVAKHHAKGKLDARARLDRLLDKVRSVNSACSPARISPPTAS